jgi:tetratricopeptide (TPR) repeat protein
MTLVQGILFASLLAMFVAWIVCINRLSRRLRERHPGKYQEMALDELWPEGLGGWLRGFDNARPVFALLRFLFRRDDYRLRDDAVVRIAGQMRVLLVVYSIVFVVLAGWIVGDSLSPGKRAPVAAAPAEQLAARATELHRAGKFAEAIAAYDGLLGPAGADAELVYWRGMAHWKLGHTVEALRDFRRAIELSPGYFEASLAADRILSSQRRFDDCIELWNGYLRAAPRDAEAYYERGGSHFHKGDLQAAHADLVRACELGKANACARAEKLKARL